MSLCRPITMIVGMVAIVAVVIVVVPVLLVPVALLVPMSPTMRTLEQILEEAHHSLLG